MKTMKTLRRMMTKVQHLMNMIQYSKLYFKITVFDNHSKSLIYCSEAYWKIWNIKANGKASMTSPNPIPIFWLPTNL